MSFWRLKDPWNEMMMLSRSDDIHFFILFTEAEVRALAKERQKKDNHNLSESVRIELIFTADFLSDSQKGNLIYF